MLRECFQSESLHVVRINIQLELAGCLTASFTFLFHRHSEPRRSHQTSRGSRAVSRDAPPGGSTSTLGLWFHNGFKHI